MLLKLIFGFVLKDKNTHQDCKKNHNWFSQCGLYLNNKKNIQIFVILFLCISILPGVRVGR